MERIDANISNPVILFEHQHRYQWASKLAKGTVLDAASGIGYGSSIIKNNINVRSYIGIDRSKEAIKHAVVNYGGPCVSFAVGDVLSLTFRDCSFDTIISLETIEHVECPTKVFAEFKRVLKDEGVFVGSIPSIEYENLIEKTYGKNNYHLSKMNLEELRDALSKHYKYFNIYSSTLDMGTTFKKVFPCGGQDKINIELDVERKLGSYIFCASNSSRHIMGDTDLEMFKYGINFIEFDRYKKLEYDKIISGHKEYSKILESRILELEILYKNPIKLLYRYCNSAINKLKRSLE